MGEPGDKQDEQRVLTDIQLSPYILESPQWLEPGLVYAIVDHHRPEIRNILFPCPLIGRRDGYIHIRLRGKILLSRYPDLPDEWMLIRMERPSMYSINHRHAQ